MANSSHDISRDTDSQENKRFGNRYYYVSYEAIKRASATHLLFPAASCYPRLLPRISNWGEPYYLDERTTLYSIPITKISSVL
ncbi:uncharacterized protein H6S33_012623 [Morchella sextelata]|uniref:uncharacterized protein n=1 Tax=Morchella sextelata TaxID=1174677 RepID=UPI001D039B86|nr:uncharacterized protein H6S33_012623 [Morchella sextelata]KAH0610077.1 hypothetical protein H6S33_012623 [Morchella sextelata]